MDDELLTTTKVARILRVDERTIRVYRNLKDNSIPFIKAWQCCPFSSVGGGVLAQGEGE